MTEIEILFKDLRSSYDNYYRYLNLEDRQNTILELSKYILIIDALFKDKEVLADFIVCETTGINIPLNLYYDFYNAISELNRILDNLNIIHNDC